MNNEKTAAAVDPRVYLVQGCERPWEVAIEPFRVSPRAYYVGNSWVGSYLIVTADGLILIDSTMHGQLYLVFESIRKLGFNPRDIRLLLLSHAHYDHIGAVRSIAEYTGAKTYMGKEDAYFLTERPDLIFCEGYPFGSFAVDAFYDNDSPIVLGGMSIRTRHSPGHTPGTTSFFFEDPDEDGTVHRCGLHGGVGLNTLDDASLRHSGWPKTIRNDYLNSLLAMRDFKIDITLGSHPNQTRMLEKRLSSTDFRAFVDPDAWGRLLDERIAMIRKMMGQDAGE